MRTILGLGFLCAAATVFAVGVGYLPKWSRDFAFWTILGGWLALVGILVLASVVDRRKID